MQNTFTITGDFIVPRLGYGAMRLTGQPNNYGPYIDWKAGKQLLRHGLDLGIRFIDTARAYGPGWNERLVADALSPYPDDLFIATKGGVVKKTATARFLDGSPEGLRRDCEDSLRNLRVDCIDLYQLHWVDPDVPFADSVAGLAILQKQGKIRRIGLSNITLDQLKEALSIAPIASRAEQIQRRRTPKRCYRRFYRRARYPVSPLWPISRRSDETGNATSLGRRNLGRGGRRPPCFKTASRARMAPPSIFKYRCDSGNNFRDPSGRKLRVLTHRTRRCRPSQPAWIEPLRRQVTPNAHPFAKGIIVAAKSLANGNRGRFRWCRRVLGRQFHSGG